MSSEKRAVKPTTTSHHLVTGMIAVSSVIVLTGCAGQATTPAAAPVTTPAQIPHPNSTQPLPAIPAVKNPRDVTAVSTRPCGLLTAQQAAGFRLDMPPDQLSGVHGTSRCMWTKTTVPDRQIIRMVNVSLSITGPAFEVVYDRDRGLPSFELADLSGYPAIVARTNTKSPICTIKIKTAEGQSLSVDYEDKELANDPQKSCEIGKQIAAAVLMNVPTKS